MKPGDDKVSDTDNAGQASGERLARFLARAGVASRRHAEELIAAGRVQVNGTTITSQGTRVDSERDSVSVDGKPVRDAGRRVYVLLNKPVGYLSTVSDPQGRSTVLDLLPPELRRLRVYPVGRLDSGSSGLLLLTNDGDFALRLSHPRYAAEKRYEALVQGQPSAATLAALRRGVTFDEDNGRRHTSAPAQVQLLRRVGEQSLLALSLHEGRKRQVRRMLAAVGHPVVALMRVGVGSLTLKGVPPGHWRYLTPAEVAALLNQS
jgi:23S rRNA pseudouridine2605 synthase